MQDIRMGYDEEGILDESRTDNPYCFDLDRNGFPVFTDKNIRLIWAMVENDSAYNSVKPETVEDIFKSVLNDEKKDVIEKAIKQAVYLTDKVNSTHLSTLRSADMDILKANKDIEKFSNVLKGKFDDKKKDKDKDEDEDAPQLQNGRFMTARKIIDDRVDLIPLIKKGDEQAVFKIAHYAETYAKEHLGIEIKKNNFSFATKFCHYVCVNGLDEEKIGRNRDLYCIYDSVVSQILPYYIWAYTDKVAPGKCRKGQTQYRLLEKLLEDCRDDDSPAGYQQFRSYYDSVIKGIDAWREVNGQSGLNVPEIGEKGELSYRHVDRLIWYYFKGRRLDEAKEKCAEHIKW